MRCLHLRKTDATGTKKFTWQLNRSIDNKVKNYRVNKAFVSWAPTETTAVTSASISALGCAYFIDLDDSSKILPASITDGTDITSATDQDDGSYVPSAGSAGMEWTAVNSTHYIKSTIAWYTFGGTCTNSETNKCILGFLYIKGAADRIIFKSSCFSEIMVKSSVLTLRQTHGDASSDVATTCTVPTDPVAITVSKNGTAFDFWMKNLVSGVVQTNSIVATTSTSTSYTAGISDASTGFIDHQVGSYFCITNNNSASLDLAQSYLESKHTGIGTPAVIDSPSFISLHSDWLCRLSKENDLIQNVSSNLISLIPYHKKLGDTVQCYRLLLPDPRKTADEDHLVGTVDLHFQTGDTVIEPADFQIELSFQS